MSPHWIPSERSQGAPSKRPPAPPEQRRVGIGQQRQAAGRDDQQRGIGLGNHRAQPAAALPPLAGPAPGPIPAGSLMSVKEFKELTTQNFITQKSAAQKRIIELLGRYHSLGRAPLPEAGTTKAAKKAAKKQSKAAARELVTARNTEVPNEKLDQADSLLADMHAAVQAWVRTHSLEDTGRLTTRGDQPQKGTKAAKRAGTDPTAPKAGSTAERYARGVVLDGVVVAGTAPTNGGIMRIDPNRQKRMLGMARFQLAIEAERQTIQSRRAALNGSVAQDPVTRDAEAADALDDHYGDFNSMFGKLGVALDTLVPRPGDSASFEISFSVPIPDTPVMITGRVTVSAKRADNGVVSAQIEIIPGVGVGVGVASFNAALGMYTSAAAASGADVMTLVSYAVYRKLRQSNVPAEITDFLWGGSATRFGALKADLWSRGVEEKLWGKEAEMAGFTWLEWGMKGEVGAQAEISALGVGGGYGAKASATAGSRYDQISLQNRKGGAGEKNQRSDSLFTRFVAASFGRGAEKDLSRRSYSVTVSTNIKAGVLAGDLSASVVLRQQGKHKDQRKGITNTSDWVFEPPRVW